MFAKIANRQKATGSLGGLETPGAEPAARRAVAMLIAGSTAGAGAAPDPRPTGRRAPAGFIDITARRDAAFGKKRPLLSRIPRPVRRALEATAARQGPISALVRRPLPYPGEVSAHLARPRSGFRRIRHVSRASRPAAGGFRHMSRDPQPRPPARNSDERRGDGEENDKMRDFDGAQSLESAAGVVRRVEQAVFLTKDETSGTKAALSLTTNGTLAGQPAHFSLRSRPAGVPEACFSPPPAAPAVPQAPRAATPFEPESSR